jgi:GNAT superfamily N-acetyltransferase
MPVVQIKDSDQKIKFPDQMSQDQILNALKRQYPVPVSQKVDDALSKPVSTISNRDVSLAENTKQKIANFLFDNKIVSDRYGAQRIGDNLSSLLGVLPGIGDAQAGDEFGKAVAEGDGFNMLAAGVGVIPVAGDVLKQTLRKAKSVNLPSGKLGADQFKIIKQSDPKAKTTVNADGSITASYLEEYQPKQIKGPLYEFEPDALELSEDTFKNTKTFKGDKDKPISVTQEAGDYKILDGHHRAKLAKEEGRNVKAVVIPIDDVAKMKKDNVHQADMFGEWVARGLYKTEAQPKSVNDISESIKSINGVKTLNLFEDRKGDIKLDTIIIDKDKRGAGVGSKVMNDLIEYADANGKRIKLTPAVQDDFQGTTSQARLKKFYKRFGFIENKGRNKDFEISELMYRDPEATK